MAVASHGVRWWKVGPDPACPPAAPAKPQAGCRWNSSPLPPLVGLSQTGLSLLQTSGLEENIFELILNLSQVVQNKLDFSQLSSCRFSAQR